MFTIDTEPDNQWSDHTIDTVNNVSWLRPLQELFANAGATPAYLLTYAVATDSDAVKILHELCRYCPTEIGAHLHPWDNEPFSDDGWDRKHPVFPHDLPIELFHRKMSALVRAIGDEFPSPMTYRAGRFGFVAEHIHVLESLGFVVDCSVTSLVDRRGKYGVPQNEGGLGGRDFRSAPIDPYHPSYKDECLDGDARLLEIPVTAGATRFLGDRWLRRLAHTPRYMRGAMARLGMVRMLTASPVQFRLDDILAMLDAAVRRGAPAINLTFHSSEVMPGGSPNFPDQASVDNLLHKVKSILTWASEHDRCRFMPTSEFARLRGGSSPNAVSIRGSENVC